MGFHQFGTKIPQRQRRGNRFGDQFDFLGPHIMPHILCRQKTGQKGKNDLHMHRFAYHTNIQ